MQRSPLPLRLPRTRAPRPFDGNLMSGGVLQGASPRSIKYQ